LDALKKIRRSSPATSRTTLPWYSCPQPINHNNWAILAPDTLMLHETWKAEPEVSEPQHVWSANPIDHRNLMLYVQEIAIWYPLRVLEKFKQECLLLFQINAGVVQ
jgi:hypothetical protein